MPERLYCQTERSINPLLSRSRFHNPNSQLYKAVFSTHSIAAWRKSTAVSIVPLWARNGDASRAFPPRPPRSRRPSISVGGLLLSKFVHRHADAVEEPSEPQQGFWHRVGRASFPLCQCTLVHVGLDGERFLRQARRDTVSPQHCGETLRWLPRAVPEKVVDARDHMDLGFAEANLPMADAVRVNAQLLSNVALEQH